MANRLKADLKLWGVCLGRRSHSSTTFNPLRQGIKWAGRRRGRVGRTPHAKKKIRCQSPEVFSAFQKAQKLHFCALFLKNQSKHAPKNIIFPGAKQRKFFWFLGGPRPSFFGLKGGADGDQTAPPSPQFAPKFLDTWWRLNFGVFLSANISRVHIHPAREQGGGGGACIRSIGLVDATGVQRPQPKGRGAAVRGVRNPRSNAAAPPTGGSCWQGAEGHAPVCDAVCGPGWAR